MGGRGQSGMIDQGCVKLLGIPPLGVHTAVTVSVFRHTAGGRYIASQEDLRRRETPLLFTRSQI